MKRFPPDFMFQLTSDEWAGIRNHVEKLEDAGLSLRSQIVTSDSKGGLRYLPYAFTEQGVAMLSSVLHSDKAISMNIAIVSVFVEMRKSIQIEPDWKLHFQDIRQRLNEHDVQLNSIYDALENMLDEKAAQRKWENRERIGFKR